MLFEYLDTRVSRGDNLAPIYVLFSELIQAQIFSHNDYIKALISNGAVLNLDDSVHRHFLENFSLPAQASHVLANQRRAVLYGSRRTKEMKQESDLLRDLQMQADLLVNEPLSMDTLSKFNSQLRNASYVVKATVCDRIGHNVFEKAKGRKLREQEEQLILLAVIVMYGSGVLRSLYMFLRRMHAYHEFNSLAISLIVQMHTLFASLDRIGATTKLLMFNKTSPFLPLALQALTGSFSEPLPLNEKLVPKIIMENVRVQRPINILSIDADGALPPEIELVISTIERSNEVFLVDLAESWKQKGIKLNSRDCLLMLKLSFDKCRLTNTAEVRALQTSSPVAQLIIFLRELHVRGIIATDGTLYECLASLIYHQSGSEQTNSALIWFLVVCVSRGVVPFDTLFSKIFHSIFSKLIQDLEEVNRINVHPVVWCVHMYVLTAFIYLSTLFIRRCRTPPLCSLFDTSLLSFISFVNF